MVVRGNDRIDGGSGADTLMVVMETINILTITLMTSITEG